MVQITAFARQNELPATRAVAHSDQSHPVRTWIPVNDYIYPQGIVNQNSLFLILAAPACAWLSGMGLFKTLFAMMSLHRWIPGGEFTGTLGHLFEMDWFLYLLSTLAAIEVVVDLAPRWDIAWHRWNGHLRIFGAMALSWMILENEDVFSQFTMAIVGASLAITSYTATTSARKAAIRGGTGVFVSPISSITENCMIAATLFPLTRLPPLTLLMIAFMTMAAMLIIGVVRREARETFQWIFTGKWVRPEITDTSGRA